MTTKTPTTMTVRICGVMAALLAAFAGGPAAAQGPEERQLTIQQTGILGVQSQPTTEVNPLRVTAWVDHQDNTYAFGEQVQLFVQTNKDAYVTVLNVDPTGATTVLFPNQFQSNNRVPANTVVQIPDRASGTAITVSGPVGAELIKVVASTEPRPPFAASQLGRAGAFSRVASGPDETARALQMVLQDQTGGEWDDYNKTILTVPQREAAVVETAGVTWPTQPFGLRLESDRPRYRLTEPVTLMVAADRTCHLTLINTGPSGVSRQIFPNRYQQNTLIQAGQTVVVPGMSAGVTLQPIGPMGMEHVTAICSEGARPPATIVTDYRSDAFPRLDASAQGRNLAVIFNDPTPAVPSTAAPMPPVATARSSVSFLVVN